MNTEKEIKEGTKLLAKVLSKLEKCTVIYAHVNGRGFDVKLEDGKKYGIRREDIIEVLEA